jgi:hypothetical protein
MANQLTKQNLSDLNNISHGARRAGLGTKLQSALSGTNKMVEAITGLVNTNFAVIDACDAKNMATESDVTIFSNTLQTTRFYKGTGSNVLKSLTSASALTHTVMRTVSSVDWSGSDKFGMMVFSNVALAEGDVQFVINATTGGLQYIDLPAIASGTPTWIELAKGAVTCADVIGYGFRRRTTKKFELTVDSIVRFLAAQSVVLGQIPAARVTAVPGIIKSSCDIIVQLIEETGHQTTAKLTEDTDYLIGKDTKRIIFMTDQSTKTGFVDYRY